MPEAELRIRHVNYPINSKTDAFWYNFAEGFGRAAGWMIVIAFALLVFKYVSPDVEANSAETELSR